MKVLKDIIRWSTYKPPGGLKGELYDLVKYKNYDTVEAKEHFRQIGKLGQFYSVNQHLKENLLDSILTMPLYGFKKSVRTRVKLLRKQLQARILLYIGSKVAGTKLAIDTIVVAEKMQDYETVFALSKELVLEYSISQPDTKKYQKYFLKLKETKQRIEEEFKAEMVYREIIHCYNTKQSIKRFNLILSGLEKLSNESYRFNFFVYSAKSVFFHLSNNYNGLIVNNKKAYSFFDSLDLDLHYITKLNFLSNSIPYQITMENFAQAESTINTCLSMPPRGSYDWHRILIYKTALGFYSGKPKIAMNAYKLGQTLKKKFKNRIVNEKWHLIWGYLALYEKLEDRKVKFRLGSYLNVNEEKRNDKQKANLIIIEMLHLLIDGKRSEFLNCLEKVEPYILNRFRAQRFKRTRYFLRLLKSVVKGNYHPVRVQAYAKRQLSNLAVAEKDLGIERIDLEIVPYEVLWEVILKKLK